MPPRSTPLSSLPGIPKPRATQLARMGLKTVGDALDHFPYRHEDRTRFESFPTSEQNQPVCVRGLVQTTSLRRFGRRRIFEAAIREDPPAAIPGVLVLRWFNIPYIHKLISAGDHLVVYGKPRLRGKRLCIEHPEFERIEEDAERLIHLDRIVPIHRASAGVSPRSLRSLLFRLCAEIAPEDFPEILPPDLRVMPRADAYRAIHFPETLEQCALARRQLVLEEFFGLQLFLANRRRLHQALPGSSHAGKGLLAKQLIENLPFPLTAAQRRAIREIRADLAAPRPMNRLLQGDVGSGKTLVAITAMLLAVEAGFRAILMAPTQILAEQHHANLRRLLDPLGIRIGLRTGTRKTNSGPLPLFTDTSTSHSAHDTEPQILVGTHALLHEKSPPERLGLVVIDEQHKFGVLQRARLIQGDHPPDVLVMTATPIPRTLCMTLFGDLDVSIIDEMPPGRGRIQTVVRPTTKLPDAVTFLRAQLDKGKQAYIVYPTIDESEKIQVKAAATEFTKWSEALAPRRVGLLHGRIAPDEKDSVMDRFRRNELSALVCTSVIEVGIDVPNATVLIVENAERFGLAQLHQLRGRVGRGAAGSYCILLAGNDGDETPERLQILEQTRDGFAIAEADLALRGPGDLLGTAQSGLPPLLLGDLALDADLMLAARTAAQALLSDDPDLALPKNQHLSELLVDKVKSSLSQIS